MLVNSQMAEKKTLNLEKTPKNEEKLQEIPTISQQTPNNDEVAQALKTLQNAGITVTIQPAQMTGMPVQGMQNYNPQMAQMSMLLGNNTNNNNGFDMLPYMMMQNQGQNQGQNNNNQYNSQMLQAMMMNYMMPSLDFTTKDKD